MKHIIFILFSFIQLLEGGVFKAQTTLQNCFDIALKNEQQLANDLASYQKSKVNSEYHKYSLLPNLSANLGQNVNWGRRLDPFTNTFGTQQVNSNSFGLSSSVQLFKGLDYLYQSRILDATLNISKIELEAKRNQRNLEIIAIYIACCKKEIQLKMAENRSRKYNEFQNIQKMLIEGGRINAIDTIRTANSLLNEQIIQANLKNDLTLAIFDLNFKLGLPLATAHQLVLSSISKIDTKPNVAEDFALKKLQLENEILKNQFNSECSNYLPSLSLSGNMSTGFSSNNKNYALPSQPIIRFNQQIDQNLYQGIGLYLNIPLFNKGAYFKSKKLQEISRETLDTNQKQLAVSLEKFKMEQEQKLVSQTALLLQQTQVASNLEIIHLKTTMLYKEGKIVYKEVDVSFLDWQAKLIEIEILKLELEQMRLFE